SDACRKRAAENAREDLPAAFQKIGEGGEREQAPVAGGEHAPQQTDDQHQMLLKRGRAAHTAVEHFARDDFEEWQKHQRRERERHEEILRFPEPAETAGGLPRRLGRNRDSLLVGAGHFAASFGAARKVFSWLMTSSKISAGTTVPRTF